MSTGDSAQERDTHAGNRALREGDLDLILSIVFPIPILNREAGLDTTVGQIRRNVNFNAIFLRIELILL